MRLYIAGIHHSDPLCRIKLIKWIKEIVEKEQTLPIFVAPEWKEKHFEVVKKQRLEFASEVWKQWPYLKKKEVEIIALSLAFEGDAYKEVFQEVPMVWLDQERNDSDFAGKTFYKYRLEELKRICSPTNKGRDLLRYISSDLQRQVSSSMPNNPSLDPERDYKFYKAIQETTNPESEGWAIIIVGMDHAAATPGRMRYLLESNGYLCIVKNLAI